MKKTLASLAIATGILSGSLAAHSLFLKLDSFFVSAHARISVPLLNGEFAKSENAIARDRMLDVSVVGPNDELRHPSESAWRDVGLEAHLELETGPSGTYTIGVSTAARVIELEADKFNSYLQHDGVLDILEKRRRDKTLTNKARESYAKHVKAIVQVGDTRSSGYEARLGYPLEIVPLQNPYSLSTGDALDVVVLKHGKPLAGQLVYASHEHRHSHAPDGTHRESCNTRTDAEGRATIPLVRAGRWYVRLIHMVERDEPELDYASEWATMTFEIAERAARPEQRKRSWLAALIAIAIVIAVALSRALRSGRRDA